MFDNVKKLIMTTSTGIVIKENKVKQWLFVFDLNNLSENNNIRIIHKVSYVYADSPF